MLVIEPTHGQELTHWSQINWSAVEATVRRLQGRIYRAAADGQVAKVKNLQKLLVRSMSAKLKAIRQVTQENGGKHTPGVDGVVCDTPEARWELLQDGLDFKGYRPKPVRRVYIPKSNGQKRPLGIPMAHAYCISLLRRLGIAVATPTSMNSVYQITQYSGLGLTNQVGACKKPSSKIAERFQLFRFFTSTRIQYHWRAIIS